MKSQDENPLLREIIEDGELSNLRRESLKHGLEIMRQQRRRRMTVRYGMLALLPVGLALSLVWGHRTQNKVELTVAKAAQNTSAAPVQNSEPSVKILSDDELFALFPGRPMALIGKPGHQQLVFLDAPTGNSQGQ